MTPSDADQPLKDKKKGHFTRLADSALYKKIEIPCHLGEFAPHMQREKNWYGCCVADGGCNLELSR
ncbi:MAG: hypothetical protein IT471_04600 [Pseudomonadales bacterium]|jgi:hypothetical protein|nr:hypothetical protein [Pseudomonadales bacterium]MCC6529530.1 hypothetical protein [Pseudomonadales bacterium]MCP5332783.1 hypothetical protein [Pseudomonadales bacterium]HMU90250.1 hypothetical protein [Pseudomonadales bacterium]HMW16087.1 hypothetical protein [Pseudomonadales bacterium]